MIPPDAEGDEILNARWDLLRVIARPFPVLACVHPRLLAISIGTLASDRPSANQRRICSSRQAALDVLTAANTPLLMAVSEHLEDGWGQELIREAKARNPAHRCLLLLTHNHRVLVEEALAAGADAIVMEEGLGVSGGLVYAVECLIKGRSFVDPLLERVLADPAHAETELSEREVETLRLVAAGLSNREIGERLHIAPTTARDHVKAVMQRLGVHNRAAAAVEGIRQGYVH